MTAAGVATIAICLAATAGLLVRPWRLSEAVWPSAGAGLIVASGLLPVRLAGLAIAKAADVCLFLVGMMVLAEMARREGLFDWAAVYAVRLARGSSARLFTLVYAIGVVVTAFMSNDATAVVLTPAVLAACRKAEVDPLPSLFACALVANAASFLLPISNPANLVLYGGALLPLGRWLVAFALPSLLSVSVTYAILHFVMRVHFAQPCRREVAAVSLDIGARIVLAGIAATVLLLLAASALDRPLGPPSAGAAVVTSVILLLRDPRGARTAIRGVSWSMLPLVVGLFVLVEALDQLKMITALARSLGDDASTAAVFGGSLAIMSNVINNLPAGLVASGALAQAHGSSLVRDAALIGIDLGPNLSITGSLATILWLAAIRREGLDVGFGQFIKIGAAVMPPALIIALAARLALS